MTEQLIMDLSTDKKTGGRNFKEYDVSGVNRKYLEAFQKAKYPDCATDKKQRMSFNQYRCTINNVLEHIQKDAATITAQDFTNWAINIDNENTRTNKLNHIKSFLNFILTKNVNFARQRSTIETLLFAEIVPEWFVKDKSILNKLTSN